MNKYPTEYELWGKVLFMYTMVIKPYKLKPFVPLPESEKAREDLDHKWFRWLRKGGTNLVFDTVAGDSLSGVFPVSLSGAS